MWRPGAGSGAVSAELQDDRSLHCLTALSALEVAQSALSSWIACAFSAGPAQGALKLWTCCSSGALSADLAHSAQTSCFGLIFALFHLVEGSLQGTYQFITWLKQTIQNTKKRAQIKLGMLLKLCNNATHHTPKLNFCSSSSKQKLNKGHAQQKAFYPIMT